MAKSRIGWLAAAFTIGLLTPYLWIRWGISSIVLSIVLSIAIETLLARLVRDHANTNLSSTRGAAG